MNILFYSSFINEIKTAIYFAKYASLSPKCITKLIEAILYLIPNRELDNGIKYLWCVRLTRNNGLPKESISLIEKFLLKEARNHKDIDYSEQTSNNQFSYKFAVLVHHYYPDYVSEILSKHAITINKASEKEINYLYKLSKILTTESRKYLFNNKSISNIKDVIDCIEENDISSISVYESIVVSYVRDSISKIENNRENGITVHRANDYLVEVAVHFFRGEIKNEELKKYKGVVDEYDMFIDPKGFDYSKFNPTWLKHYTDALLTKIAENKYMRDRIVQILKKNLVNSEDNTLLKILLEHFV